MPGGIREIEIILPLCGPWLFSLEAFKLLLGGGGFKYFLNVHPENWGRLDSHFDVCIFFKGVGEKPPN